MENLRNNLRKIYGIIYGKFTEYFITPVHNEIIHGAKMDSENLFELLRWVYWITL